MKEFRENIENDKSYFSPDGGFIFASYENKEVCVLVTESKHQGTNDKRIEEGLKPQAKGNAIERSAKNFTELTLLLEDQKSFPMLLFCSGFDFHVGSTIRDRASALCQKDPFGILYAERDSRGRGRASVMFRQEKWINDEVINLGSELARKVIKIEFGL